MILIVGASGVLGGAVTRMLLERGKSIRILVRATTPLFKGVEIVHGDLKDRASLDAACRGVDTVITTANSLMRGGEDNVQTVDLEGNRHLIDAAKAAGVKHFIFVSATAADPDSPAPLLQAKGKTDAYLRASGMPYTIIAPNVYIETGPVNFIGGPAMNGQPAIIVGEGCRKHSFVSISDVAAFIIASVDHPAAMNSTVYIGGPEALSMRDIVVAYERVLGRPVQTKHVPPGQSVPGIPEVGLQVLASLDMFDSPMDMTETARTFGVRLTSLEEVVRRSTAGAASD